MKHEPLRFVICGLSITSSWGNGHATTYRSLVRELSRRGHDVLFLERDVPWYAENRDLPYPHFCNTVLYSSLEELKDRFTSSILEADVVIAGSYVPDGTAIGEWITSNARGVAAFYDIDTPVTLSKLRRNDYEYLSPHLIPRYHLYLSFTGGSTLKRLEQEWGSPMARVLYCSVDPDAYYPEETEILYDLGYIGTYGPDRQRTLEALLTGAAERWREGRFVVAGPQYPACIRWPSNLHRIDHLAPSKHRRFYNSQRFTLNVTRADMVRAGYSPSVRLFEAAACGTPIVSDYWEGLESLFTLGKELLIAGSASETLAILHETTESERRRIGSRCRQRVLAHHTAAQRAKELEFYVREAQSARHRLMRPAVGATIDLVPDARPARIPLR